MIVNIYSTLIWITAALVGGLTLLTYTNNKNISSRAFALSIFFAFIWMIGCGFLISATTNVISDFFSRFTYFCGSVIATSFFYFFKTFPENKKPSKKFTASLVILELIFLYLFFFTDTMIHNISPSNSPAAWKWEFGIFSPLFEIFFFGFFSIGLFKLFKKYKKYKGGRRKKLIKHIFMIIFFGSIPPFLFSIIFPRFGYFDLNWLGPVSAIFWISIMTYAISRHKLFNIKIIAIQSSIFALWILLFFKISYTEDIKHIIDELALLGVSIFFGSLLIYSILIEIQQREHIQELTENLSEACQQLRSMDEYLEKNNH